MFLVFGDKVYLPSLSRSEIRYVNQAGLKFIDICLFNMFLFFKAMPHYSQGPDICDTICIPKNLAPVVCVCGGVCVGVCVCYLLLPGRNFNQHF